MPAAKDPVEIAYLASKDTCRLIADLAEEIEHIEVKEVKHVRTLVEALGGLITRAKTGPQILVARGPAAFLIYVFSKAIEIIDENKDFLPLLVKKRDVEQKDAEMLEKLSSTTLSYFFYAYTLVEMHRLLGVEPVISTNTDQDQHLWEVIQHVDGLVRLYLEPGSLSFTRLLRSVESIARILPLYASPAYTEANERLKTKDYGAAAKALVELCKPRGGE